MYLSFDLLVRGTKLLLSVAIPRLLARANGHIVRIIKNMNFGSTVLIKTITQCCIKK